MKHTFTLFMLVVFTLTKAQQKHTVYFDFDIDEANSSSVTRLDDWMTQNKNAVIEKVYGYADSKGNNDYNIHLSQRRADDVIEKLKAYGIIVRNNVEVKAFGEDFEQDKDQAKNRKVEIYYALNDEVRTESKPHEPKQDESESDEPESDESKSDESKSDESKSDEPEFAKQVGQAKVGDKLRLPKLYFYNNSNIVVPGSEQTLSGLLVIMRKYPKLKIDIQGHICCQTEEIDNLSARRARTVYNYLMINGISSDRLYYQGFKSSRPVYPLPEKNEDERDANRRVEIEIIEN